MRLSAPVQHLFLVEKGWTHDTLNAMSEDEFGFWYDEAMAFEEARADAIRAASDKGRT